MSRPPPEDWRRRLGEMAREALVIAAARSPGAVDRLDVLLRDAGTRFGRWREARRAAAHRAPRRTRLLWILPLPLLPAAAISLARGNLLHFALEAGAYALLLGGTLLAGRGLAVEARLRQRHFDNLTPLPWKLAGWLTVGLGTALAAIAAGREPLVAGVSGAVAAGACCLLYGLDPHARAVTAAAGNARVSEALALAEERIIAIESAREGIDNPELAARLRRIADIARRILGEIAVDPEDMRRARRFLVSYLDGAQRVVTGYAERHRHDQSGELEQNFRRVLVTIEEVFEAQYRRLLERDLRDLDIQIEVLAEQMQREGLG